MIVLAVSIISKLSDLENTDFKNSFLFYLLYLLTEESSSVIVLSRVIFVTKDTTSTAIRLFCMISITPTSVKLLFNTQINKHKN